MSDSGNSSPSASTPSVDASSVKSKGLIELFKSTQFYWFIGHLLTLTCGFFYALSYVARSRCHKFWFVLAFIGIVQSFGILVFQSLRKNGTSLLALTKDDNFQYFLLGLAFLLLRPYVLLPLAPFILFSFFHVLAYTRGYILPAFNLGESGIASTIENFTSNNNSRSIALASILEMYSLFWLTLRLLLFRKNSLFPWIVYVVFIKVRFEKSVLTRKYFKDLELQVEGAVNRAGHPKIKELWMQFKSILREAGNFYLVNDYTKEKQAYSQ